MAPRITMLSNASGFGFLLAVIQAHLEVTTPDLSAAISIYPSGISILIPDGIKTSVPGFTIKPLLLPKLGTKKSIPAALPVPRTGDFTFLIFANFMVTLFQ